MTLSRSRLLGLVAICVLAIAAALAFFGYARSSAEAQLSAAPAVGASADLATLLAQDHVVFRSTALGDSYGRVGVVALAEPTGPWAVLDANCERVYATASAGVCLTADRGVVTSYGITELDATLSPTTSAALSGPPSRARMSPDGSLIATTVFVNGHSYSAPSFSTETVIRRSSGELIGSIEDFAGEVDGEPFTPVDRNYWGVTFVDDDTFYATGASSTLGTTWLMRGSVAARTLTSIRTDAECPSVSPDHTRVAYKTRQGDPAPGRWHIAVLDLATGIETVLAETSSVDDQVEWLDDATVLYAIPRDGSEVTSDIWQVPADGTGKPAIFIEQAASPAVVRQSSNR